MRWKAFESKAGQFEACKRWLKSMSHSAITGNAIKLESRCAHWILSAVWSLALAAATALLAGCETSGSRAVMLSSPYKPNNIFIAAPQLPGDLKRVAVLPLASGGRRTDLAEGRDALGPVLIAELIKAKKFEVIPVPPGELNRLTGRMDWTSEEVLPASLLGLLEKEYGCDAVLFCELTEFRAYAPLAVGWRLKLVDVRSQKTIWAGDEHFDAGNPAVIAGAQCYQRREQVAPDNNSGLRRAGVSSVLDVTGGIIGWVVGDGQNASAKQAGDWLAINSPRRFGQYSIGSLLGTLPAR